MRKNPEPIMLFWIDSSTFKLLFPLSGQASKVTTALIYSKSCTRIIAILNTLRISYLIESVIQSIEPLQSLWGIGLHPNHAVLVAVTFYGMEILVQVTPERSVCLAI